MTLWELILIYALGMAVIVYLLTILPAKRKNRKMRAMHASVAPGDLITTIGGVVAKVKARNGDTVTLLIDEATGTTMQLIIYAVQTIVEKAPGSPEEPDKEQ